MMKRWTANETLYVVDGVLQAFDGDVAINDTATIIEVLPAECDGELLCYVVNVGGRRYVAQHSDLDTTPRPIPA